MSSIAGLRAFAARPTGFEKEVLMLIRTTCPDKWLNRQQVVEEARFITPSARNPKPFYTGRNDGLRILCGSI
jgi:hypothetical protein